MAWHSIHNVKTIARVKLDTTWSGGGLSEVQSVIANQGTVNNMYAICSNLLDDEGLNCLCVIQFDDEWQGVRSIRHLPLPTQDSCCHRVAVVNDGPPETHSVVVSELSSSKLFQVMLSNLHDPTILKEVPTKQTEGHRVRKFQEAGGLNSKNAATVIYKQVAEHDWLFEHPVHGKKRSSTAEGTLGHFHLDAYVADCPIEQFIGQFDDPLKVGHPRAIERHGCGGVIVCGSDCTDGTNPWVAPAVITDEGSITVDFRERHPAGDPTGSHVPAGAIPEDLKIKTVSRLFLFVSRPGCFRTEQKQWVATC